VSVTASKDAGFAVRDSSRNISESGIVLEGSAVWHEFNIGKLDMEPEELSRHINDPVAEVFFHFLNFGHQEEAFRLATKHITDPRALEDARFAIEFMRKATRRKGDLRKRLLRAGTCFVLSDEARKMPAIRGFAHLL
jgi:hypothetical protein